MNDVKWEKLGSAVSPSRRPWYIVAGVAVAAVVGFALLLLVVDSVRRGNAAVAATPTAAISEGMNAASMLPGGGATDTSGATAPEPTVAPTKAPAAAPTAVATPVLPTLEPTLAPTPMPTVVATPTVPVLDWVNDPEAAYKNEQDTKVDWPTVIAIKNGPDSRGLNPRTGVTYTIQPGQPYAFFTHGSFWFNGKTVLTVAGEAGVENVTVVLNETAAPQEFLLKDFAGSGFGLWVYLNGTTPNVELLARYTLARPTHCGYTKGCVSSTARVLHITDAGVTTDSLMKFSATTDALKVEGSVEKPFSWTAVSAEDAFAWEKNRTSQPVQMLIPDTGVISVPLGVTYGKDQVLFSTTALTITTPDGAVHAIPAAPMGTKTVVVLSNIVSDTLVYHVEGIPDTGVEFWEYGYSRIPNVDLLVRYYITPDTSMARAMAMKGATVTPAEGTAFVLYSNGTSQKLSYDQPLGVK